MTKSAGPQWLARGHRIGERPTGMRLIEARRRPSHRGGKTRTCLGAASSRRAGYHNPLGVPRRCHRHLHRVQRRRHHSKGQHHGLGLCNNRRGHKNNRMRQWQRECPRDEHKLFPRLQQRWHRNHLQHCQWTHHPHHTLQSRAHSVSTVRISHVDADKANHLE